MNPSFQVTARKQQTVYGTPITVVNAAALQLLVPQLGTGKAVDERLLAEDLGFPVKPVA
jgi:hypothetical protein